MSQQLTPDPMHFPTQQAFPQGYPMMNPYGPGYMPTAEMINFQQAQLNPDVFQMYMQLHMNNLAPGVPGIPGMPPQAYPKPEDLQPPQINPDGIMGNNTMTPPLSAQQPQNLVSPHVSPHYPAPTHPQMAHMTPTQTSPNSDQQFNNQTPIQENSQVSPYAINNLLSTQSSPVDGNEEKEDTTVRRNTLPTTASTNRKRRRSKADEAVVPRVPPNFTANYTPMMMQNFAALMDPYYNRRDVCVICGDNATGYHYGVMSCEGCKGFFRRTVHKKVEYTCQKGQACTFSFENCSLNRGTRTRCQACRYKRCIQMGMNKDNVRLTKESEKMIKEEHSLSSDTPSEIKDLINSFTSTMPISTHFASTTHAMSSIKKFIQTTPQLISVLPKDDPELDLFIQRIQGGILEIRAAFTFDPISFVSFDDAKFVSGVTMLRTGLRNTVFTDNEMALLTGIFILQTANGVESNVFPIYCQGLRNEFTKTHPYEIGICDRTLTKLGSQIR